MSNGKIFIEREPIMIKEKAYMAYYIKGKISNMDFIMFIYSHHIINMHFF